MSVKRPRRLSNRERCFSKGCQNEFVTRSVNLRRKRTVERETFPRHPQSVRLIKSHGWSESWETEPERAPGACSDSRERKNEGATCKYDHDCMSHVCLLIPDPRDLGWDSAHQRAKPSAHPPTPPSGDIKQVRAILKFTQCNMTGQR